MNFEPRISSPKFLRKLAEPTVVGTQSRIRPTLTTTSLDTRDGSWSFHGGGVSKVSAVTIDDFKEFYHVSLLGIADEKAIPLQPQVGERSHVAIID